MSKVKRAQERQTEKEEGEQKILDANSMFLIPLSVCMSDRDQRWRNVT